MDSRMANELHPGDRCFVGTEGGCHLVHPKAGRYTRSHGTGKRKGFSRITMFARPEHEANDDLKHRKRWHDPRTYVAISVRLVDTRSRPRYDLLAAVEYFSLPNLTHTQQYPLTGGLRYSWTRSRIWSSYSRLIESPEMSWRARYRPNARRGHAIIGCEIFIYSFMFFELRYVGAHATDSRGWAASAPIGTSASDRGVPGWGVLSGSPTLSRRRCDVTSTSFTVPGTDALGPRGSYRRWKIRTRCARARPATTESRIATSWQRNSLCFALPNGCAALIYPFIDASSCQCRKWPL